MNSLLAVPRIYYYLDGELRVELIDRELLDAVHHRRYARGRSLWSDGEVAQRYDRRFLAPGFLGQGKGTTDNDATRPRDVLSSLKSCTVSWN